MVKLQMRTGDDFPKLCEEAKKAFSITGSVKFTYNDGDDNVLVTVCFQCLCRLGIYAGSCPPSIQPAAGHL